MDYFGKKLIGLAGARYAYMKADETKVTSADHEHVEHPPKMDEKYPDHVRGAEPPKRERYTGVGYTFLWFVQFYVPLRNPFPDLMFTLLRFRSPQSPMTSDTTPANLRAAHTRRGFYPPRPRIPPSSLVWDSQLWPFWEWSDARFWVIKLEPRSICVTESWPSFSPSLPWLRVSPSSRPPLPRLPQKMRRNPWSLSQIVVVKINNIKM